MSEDPTSPTQTPMLFAEDSLASHSVTRGDSRLKTTPVTSGQRCLGLSGNAGPLGLLEKTKNGKGLSGQLGGHGEAGPEEWWAVEPSVGRLVNGLPNRVPQLRALGNSIVPQIAEEIGNAIKVAEQWKP